MKNSLLLCLTLLGSSLLFAQDNPYSKYGFEPKIATMTNGKYIEVHDQDTIVQIGRVIYNTMSREIVGFIEYDTLYSEATLAPDVVSRWLSPDPLAAQFPSRSPYEGFASNPIYYIDPDGRAVKAANADALVLLNSVFASFNTTINGQEATGAQLFGFSQKDPNSAVFATSATLEQFQGLLAQSSLSKEQQSQATSIFKVVAAQDVIEVGLVNQSSNLSTQGADGNGNNASPILFQTNNSDANTLVNNRGTMSNSQIRDGLLQQKTSGNLSNNSAFGFFSNSSNSTPVGGIVGALLINSNATNGTGDGTMSFGQPTGTQSSFGAARTAITEGLIEFSGSKEFKKTVN